MNNDLPAARRFVGRPNRTKRELFMGIDDLSGEITKKTKYHRSIPTTTLSISLENVRPSDLESVIDTIRREMASVAEDDIETNQYLKTITDY
jgi:hypothetical protein